VKVTVCYEAAFVALQLLCHLADGCLPLSRAARIEARHIFGVLLMAFVILVRVTLLFLPHVHVALCAAVVMLVQST
jgi:hypothetical protein